MTDPNTTILQRLMSAAPESDVACAAAGLIAERDRLVRECDRLRDRLPLQDRAVADILAERLRQDAKWGEQNLDPITYLAVLTEEVGELAQAALHTRFGGPAATGLREEAVHTAAVALAIVECLDRGRWRWSGEEPPQ